MILPIYKLLLIIIIILLIARYVFKLTYINCFDIIKEHINCFRGHEGKLLILPIAIYFITPILIAYKLVEIKLIDKDSINIITIIISILTTMFFTLLTLIIEIRTNIKNDRYLSDSEVKILAKLIRETYYSIMFEIFVSIIILLMCFINLFTNSSTILESGTMYFLIFTLIINMFMVLKRIFKVIEKVMDLKKF